MHGGVSMKYKTLSLLMLAIVSVVLVSGCIGIPGASIVPVPQNNYCTCQTGELVCEYSFSHPASASWIYGAEFRPEGLPCFGSGTYWDDGVYAMVAGRHNNGERNWYSYNGGVVVDLDNPVYYTEPGATAYFTGVVRFVSELDRYKCQLDSECSWCGDTCYHEAEKPSICPTSANPGYRCGCFEGICDEIPIWECWTDEDCSGLSVCDTNLHTCIAPEPEPTPEPIPDPNPVPVIKTWFEWLIQEVAHMLNWILSIIK